MIRTLDDLLAQDSDAPALIWRGAQISYAQLNRMVEAASQDWRALGLAPGARVAVYLAKTPETVAALFAASRAGMVVVPVNPVLKAPQVRHILEDSGAEILVSAAARLVALREAEALPPGLRALYSIDADTLSRAWPGPAADAKRTPGHFAPAALDDGLAAILYTSGSTGRPKGVMLSHRNLLLSADSVRQYLAVTATDRLLAALPFSFDYGLNQLTCGFLAGACVSLIDYLTPRDVVRAVARDGITLLGGVPPLWSQLAAAEWPDDARASLRAITNSGGRMPRAVLGRLRALLPDTRIFLMYGLTEAFRSTYLDPSLVDARPDSIGKAIPYAEVYVCRPDGSLTDPGEPGEIVHLGPLVAQGYWRDAERTAARFREPPAAAGPRAPGERAVWSGDKAVRDADGFLTFVGRDDEMIKTSGYRVSPTEVEEAAYASGLVADCVALGVPDPALGEAIVLVAAPVADMADAEAGLPAAMTRALPGFMLPRRIIWRESLPRNPNGKLDRPTIAAAARAELEA